VLIAAFFASYLLGSFPTGFLLVKWLKRVDVRTIGSGNIGATNVARIAGWWASALVFLVDAVKGMIAVGLVAPLLLAAPTPVERFGCGVAAILGHTFPVFLMFRGGKGVATTLGVLLAAMPEVAFTTILIWGLCVTLWKYVSVGSLAAALVVPLLQLAERQSRAEVLLGTAVACLIVVRHRENIQRLREGREHRIGSRA